MNEIGHKQLHLIEQMIYLTLLYRIVRFFCIHRFQTCFGHYFDCCYSNGLKVDAIDDVDKEVLHFGCLDCLAMPLKMPPHTHRPSHNWKEVEYEQYFFLTFVLDLRLLTNKLFAPPFPVMKINGVHEVCL